MANYGLVPSPRMPFSVDGTVGFNSSGSSVIELSSTTMNRLDDEEGYPDSPFSVTGASPAGVFGVVFPQRRDLGGFFVSASEALGAIATSTNTTTGIDGDWITQRNSFPSLVVFPNYRTRLAVMSVPGIRGLRFTCPEGTTTAIYGLHVYGTITAGEAPTSRLGFWHPTLDQALPGSWFDWGDAQRSTTATKTFRIRNRSTTQTANNVALSVVAPTDLTPGIAGAHSYSLDGTTFTSTVNISAIAPNSYSPVITLRRVLASNQRLSLFAFRLQTATGSWS